MKFFLSKPCVCARPGRGTGDSHVSPTVPGISPAPRQHVMAGPQILTRHPGNSSRQPSDINPADRQYIPADHETLTRQPGNTSRHTLNIGPGTPATLPGTCSAINPARHALPTDFRHHMATMLI